MACLEIPVSELDALSEAEKEEISVSCQPELWFVFFRPPQKDEVGMQPFYQTRMRDAVKVAYIDHPRNVRAKRDGCRVGWWCANPGALVADKPVTDDGKTDLAKLATELQKVRAENKTVNPYVPEKDLSISKDDDLHAKVLEAQKAPAWLRLSSGPDPSLKPVPEKEAEPKVVVQ